MPTERLHSSRVNRMPLHAEYVAAVVVIGAIIGLGGLIVYLTLQ
jgi:hypothetical protein